MSSSDVGTTAVWDFLDFEGCFLSAAPMAPQDLPADLVDDIREVLSRNDGTRTRHKEDIGAAVLDAINNLRLVKGHYGRGYWYASQTSEPQDDVAIALLYPKRHTPSVAVEEEDWSRARFLIQFESGGARYDPHDRGENASPSSDRALEASMAQVVANVRSIFQYQHRAFLFSLYINDRYIRVMRWDRSGVVVSRPVDYLRDSAVLPRLLWRLGQLNDIHQGLDISATRVEETSEDYRLMDSLGIADPNLDIATDEGTIVTSYTAPMPTVSALGQPVSPACPPRVFQHVRKVFRQSLSDGWPRYRLKIGAEGREFLVAKPVVGSEEPLFGRSSRAYVAINCATRTFVWLKDSWRPRNEASNPEGAILARFTEDPKLYVPTLVCHGYVPQENVALSTDSRHFPRPPSTAHREHTSEADRRSAPEETEQVIGVKRGREEDRDFRTLGPDSTKRPRYNASPRPEYSHYRLVVQEIGLDFENFTTGWQLSRLTFDCVRTHARAYKNYGILHGDISPGNMLVCPTITRKDGQDVVMWRGMLVDWELATFVREDGIPLQGRKDAVPVLSWPYASVERVQNPYATNLVEHDLEAFFHVMLWYAIRFLRHNIPAGLVERFVTEYFDTFKQDHEGHLSSSDRKIRTITGARVHTAETAEVLFYDDDGALIHPLNGLLFDLLKRLQARYAVAKWDQEYCNSGTQPPAKPKDIAASGHISHTRPLTEGSVLRDAQNLAARVRSAARGPKAPSPKTRELARSLQSHAGTIQLFSKWVVEKARDWPQLDKVGDRLPADYVLSRHIVDVPHTSSGTSTKKRAKLADAENTMAPTT